LDHGFFHALRHPVPRHPHLHSRFWLAVALWLLVLVVFFAVVGWGFFGLGVSPKLIVGAAIPHLLFAIFLWGLCRLQFRSRAPAYS